MDFSVPEWAVRPERSGNLFLSIQGQKEARWCIDEKACYSIGRSVGCAIPLTDCRNASRLHACLCHGRDTKLYVIDLGSTHGTFLDGEKLQPDDRKEIRPGASIRFADWEEIFTVKMEGTAESPGTSNRQSPQAPDTANEAGGQEEEYDPFGDIGMDDTSPQMTVPLPAPPVSDSPQKPGVEIPPPPCLKAEAREGRRGDHRHGSVDRSRRSRRESDRRYHGDDRHGDRRKGRHGDRSRRRDSHRRDGSPWQKDRGRRQDRRNRGEADRGRGHFQGTERKRRRSAFSNEAAQDPQSADIVKSMMQAPGQEAQPTMGLTLEQKKQMLWGKKKQTKVVKAGGAFGANRWDTAEFESTEERQKFQRLMGVKGDGATEDPDDPDRKVLAGEAQEKLLRSVEEHFVAGLRRADGRTVGLGL